MIKSKLRKIAFVFSSLAVLSGGLGIDTAYRRWWLPIRAVRIRQLKRRPCGSDFSARRAT